MRRVLRLPTLWLFALALLVQGALAATVMRGHAGGPSQTMTMPGGATMDATDMPRHGHAIDKSGSGGGCAPIFMQQAMLFIERVPARWAALPRTAADATSSLFLTGGTDRAPPQPSGKG
jgi:hypothetical protein